MTAIDRVMNAVGWTRTLPDGRQYDVEKTDDGYFATPIVEGKNDSVPAVWACVNLKSGVMSRLPIRVVKIDGDGVPVPDMSHPMTELLMEPTLHYDTYSFYDIFYRRFFKNGNAYLIINRDDSGRPSTLGNCLTGQVEVRDVRGPSGRTIKGLVYQLNLGPIQSATVTVDAGQVINAHGPGLEMNGLYSPSPLLYAARQSIQSHDLAGQRNQRSLINGLATSLLFTSTATNAKPDPKVLKELKKIVDEEINGLQNSGKAAVLPPTISPANVGQLSGIELKVIDIMKWSLVDICRVFGVPPRLIGHYEQGVRAENGMFQRSVADFLKWNMEPDIRRLESAFSKKLLTMEERVNGYRVMYDLNEFEKGTMRERAEIAELLVTRAMVWTPNQGRRYVDNSPPVDGGDRLVSPKGAPDQNQNNGENESV